MKAKLFILFFSFALTYNVCAQKVISLYNDKEIPNSIIALDNNEKPTLEIFLPLREKSTGTSVIIFPGGAYTFIAYQEEGTDIAKAFVERGIAAFVVKYRLPKNSTMKDKSFGPLMDAQKAIMIVRTNATAFNLDPNKIGLVGYSAGGHLASTLGTHFVKSYISNTKMINLRPDFMILIYPVISMKDNLTHIGSKISLLGMEPTQERVDLFSNELQVSKDTPPTYLTHCGDDQVVGVNNSIFFYQALQKNGVDAELHLYPKGDHGFTQRLPVDVWINPMLDFIRKEGFYK